MAASRRGRSPIRPSPLRAAVCSSARNWVEGPRAEQQRGRWRGISSSRARCPAADNRQCLTLRTEPGQARLPGHPPWQRGLPGAVSGLPGRSGLRWTPGHGLTLKHSQAVCAARSSISLATIMISCSLLHTTKWHRTSLPRGGVHPVSTWVAWSKLSAPGRANRFGSVSRMRVARRRAGMSLITRPPRVGQRSELPVRLARYFPPPGVR